MIVLEVKGMSMTHKWVIQIPLSPLCHLNSYLLLPIVKQFRLAILGHWIDSLQIGKNSLYFDWFNEAFLGLYWKSLVLIAAHLHEMSALNEYWRGLCCQWSPMIKNFLAGIPKLYPSATHFLGRGGGDWSYFGGQGNFAIVITIKYIIYCKF